MISLIFITFLFGLGYAPLRAAAIPELRRHLGPGFLVSLFVPMTLGILFPHPWFFLGLQLATFLLTTRDRVDAACRYALLMVLTPTVVWVLSWPGYIGEVSTADVLSLGLLLKCVARPDRRTAPLRGFTREDAFIAVIFLIGWIGAQRLGSVSIVARSLLEESLTLLLPYLALRTSLRSSREFMLVIGCFAVAVGLISVMAVYEATHGWSIYSAFTHVSDRSGINKNLAERGGILRASTSMSGPLMLGFVLLVGFIASLYSRPFFRRPWMPIALSLLIMTGIVMTQSRSNLALIPVALLIFAVLRRKWGLATAVGLGAPVAAATLYLLAPVVPQLESLLHLQQESSSSLTADVYDYRQLLLQRGLEVAAQHRWTGASLPQVLVELEDITQGQHIVDLVNTYLTWYLVSGLAGMVPFFICFGMIWYRLATVRVRWLGEPALVDLRAFALTALAAVTFQLSVMSFIDRMPFALVVPVVAARLVGLERSRRMRLRRTAATAPAQGDPAPASPVRAPQFQPARAYRLRNPASSPG